MRIISIPERDGSPKPPSWWRSIGKRTGTVVEHNGAKWVLGYHASDWFGTDGRMWLPVEDSNTDLYWARSRFIHESSKAYNVDDIDPTVVDRFVQEVREERPNRDGKRIFPRG